MHRVLSGQPCASGITVAPTTLLGCATVKSKLATILLWLLTATLSLIGFASLLSSIGELSSTACTRESGISCGVPGLGDVPWLGFAVAIFCFVALYRLLRK